MGVLVQDLGLAKIIRQRYPTLPLHASTQMTHPQPGGRRLLEEMGFAQVVLAPGAFQGGDRRHLRRDKHAVRGLCARGAVHERFRAVLPQQRAGGAQRQPRARAQPCRLDFKSHGRGYALSLKDLTLTDRGGSWRRWGWPALSRGPSEAPRICGRRRDRLPPVPGRRSADLETLQSVFSRSGFTDGYYTARRDLTMFGTRTREDAAAAAEVLGKLSALTRNEVAACRWIWC